MSDTNTDDPALHGTDSAARQAWPKQTPVRVAVLVDLARGPGAGGHVRAWERLARAAAASPDPLDLTVHVSGARDEVQTLPVPVGRAPHVRFVAHRPVFSTARLPFLSHVPDHTDLAPHHPRLARWLGACDVIHTTDAFFAFARTAVRVARRRGVPLVNSVHTDTPRYTRLYTARTIERLAGAGAVGRLLLHGLDLPARAEAAMHRRLREHQRRCAFAWASRPDEAAALATELTGARVGLLRRGIDRAVFRPTVRDRAAVRRTLHVPEERVLVLYAGRLDPGKNLMVLVEAVAALIEEGLPLHLLCAGNGPLRDVIEDRLGARVSCPGVLDENTLALAYASADLFAQPSEIEECSNVVLEALVSGAPVLVSARGGSGRLLGDGGGGLVVEGDGAAPWARALRGLALNAERRRQLAQAALAWADKTVPSWQDVLARDLLPVWLEVARGAAPPRRR